MTDKLRIVVGSDGEGRDVDHAAPLGEREGLVPFIVIAYDAEFRELGWWGPRPAALQAWVMAERGDGPGAIARLSRCRSC